MTPETFTILKVQAIGTKVLKLFLNSEFQATESPQTGCCITCQSAKKLWKAFMMSEVIHQSLQKK